MLAKDPAARFATPGELAAALQPFVVGSNLLALAKPGVDDPTNPTNASPIRLSADTAEAAKTLATARPRPVKQTRKISRRAAIALGLAGLCLATTVGVTYWAAHRDGENTSAPKTPARIEEMIVRDHGDESRKLVGDIAKTTQPIFTDHDLQISMKFNAPAYFYLIAFNPDGTEQLLYPEDPALQVVQYPRDKNAMSMTTPPVQSQELRVPREGKYFTPDIDGLQAFVLIASAEPLPPYAEWRSRQDATPWNSNRSYKSDSRWQFDGEEFLELPQDRLQVRGGPPKEFRDLCNFLRGLPNVQAIHAIAFPVTKK
jgi:hypothetical protein